MKKTTGAKIYAIANHKGGVGKSTTAAAIGEGLALEGYKVLFIDLDAQADLTLQLQADNTGGAKTAADVIFNGTPAEQAIQHTTQGDIIPAADQLIEADTRIKREAQRLNNAISPLRLLYDFIVIDTPPALNMLTINALTAADSVIIPIGADTWSIKAIGKMYNTIDAIQATSNPALKVEGLLLTRYNPRTNLSRDLLEIIERAAQRLQTKVFKAAIHESVTIKEAQTLRAGIQVHAPHSKPALDYKALVKELLA